MRPPAHIRFRGLRRSLRRHPGGWIIGVLLGMACGLLGLVRCDMAASQQDLESRIETEELTAPESPPADQPTEQPEFPSEPTP